LVVNGVVNPFTISIKTTISYVGPLYFEKIVCLGIFKYIFIYGV